MTAIMSAARLRVLLLALFSILFVGRSPSSGEQAPNNKRETSPALALARMPIRFEANAGQHPNEARFVARRGTAALVLGDEGATLSIHQRRAPKVQRGVPGRTDVDMRSNRVVLGYKVAGGRTVKPVASEQLATKTNYFIGSDRSKWHTNIPTYAKVTYPNVLDGVDLVYHGENGSLEYDFVVAPGTSVETVAMNVEGAGNLTLTDSGELRIHTYAGDIVQPRPVVYQRDAKGAKHTVASSYRLVGREKVAFQVGDYDRARPLVIDPVIGFATYLGGTGYDDLTGVAIDAAGNTYVTGATYSVDFPTVNAYDATFNSYNPCPSCTPFSEDVFVAKLTSDGSALAYSTYIGGLNTDWPSGIAIDAGGDAYVTGWTTSFDYPLKSEFNTRACCEQDGFVSRLSADGSSLVYSSYLAGSGEDEPSAIAVDATGIYVAGSTTSADLTAPPVEGGGGAKPQGGASGKGDLDAFVVKLTPAGNAAIYVKYLGGLSDDYGTALAVDSGGSAFIAGYTWSNDFPAASSVKATCTDGNDPSYNDAFVAKLDDTGTNFTYVSCFGGTNNESAYGIAVDSTGSAYVTGDTWSDDFAGAGSIQPYGGNGDAFVTKLAPAGSSVVYSTFIGGTDGDYGRAIALDSTNTAWVTGNTSSEDFPTVMPVQAAFGGGGGEGGPADAFVARVNAAGTALVFSTFYGGSTEADYGTAIAAKGSTIVVGGSSYSTDLPVLNAKQATNAGEQDGWVSKLTAPALLINPQTATVPVGDGLQFAAAGGAGFGYTFSLKTNASGGSISAQGAYLAGNVGGSVDIVEVTDAAGLTATATVQVGQNTPTLVLNPTSANVAPKGSRTFSAGGGVPPYSYSLASNASGALINGTGVYTAGTKGNVTDIVRVTDQAGSSVTAIVTVGAAITITPAKPTVPPNGSVNFNATGGSNTGYVWALTKNSSNGSIVAGTGKYTAGSGTNTFDTVQVTDSLGNKASVNVSVGGGLAVTPADPSTTTRGTIAFSAVGGSSAYTWALTSAPSGGTINAGSGEYVAGTTGNTVDVVKVTDTVGNSASVQVIVGPGLTISPTAAETLTGGKLTFGAAGGSGTGYTYALVSNQSGGGIGAADGIYTAGTNAGVDVVRLTDSLGSTADATITVNQAPVTQLPDGGTNIPDFDAGTIPGLNIGGGGVNEDCSCRAVGSSSSLPGSTRGGIAGLALALGFVVRRRRR
jgi:hypothetical protein